MMKKLNELTGDTIVLATRNGLYEQYIRVIQATSPARLHMTLGTARPLAASGPVMPCSAPFPTAT